MSNTSFLKFVMHLLTQDIYTIYIVLSNVGLKRQGVGLYGDLFSGRLFYA